MQITISIDPSNDKQVAEAIVFLSQFTKAAAPAATRAAKAAPEVATNKPKRGRPARKAPEQAAPVEPKSVADSASSAEPAPAAAAPAKVGVFSDMVDPLEEAIKAEPAKPVTYPQLGDVQVAIEKLVGRKGLPFTREVLSRYGVQRGRDLLETQRGAFITEAYTLAQEPTR